MASRCSIFLFVTRITCVLSPLVRIAPSLLHRHRQQQQASPQQPPQHAQHSPPPVEKQQKQQQQPLSEPTRTPAPNSAEDVRHGEEPSVPSSCPPARPSNTSMTSSNPPSATASQAPPPNASRRTSPPSSQPTTQSPMQPLQQAPIQHNSPVGPAPQGPLGQVLTLLSSSVFFGQLFILCIPSSFFPHSTLSHFPFYYYGSSFARICMWFKGVFVLHASLLSSSKNYQFSLIFLSVVQRFSALK